MILLYKVDQNRIPACLDGTFQTTSIHHRQNRIPACLDGTFQTTSIHHRQNRIPTCLDGTFQTTSIHHRQVVKTDHSTRLLGQLIWKMRSQATLNSF